VLQELYRAIVIAKLFVTPLAPGGASRRQTTDSIWIVLFDVASVKVNCASDLDIFGIIDQAGENVVPVSLFLNANLVVSSLLPGKTDQLYYLRARRHDRQLADKTIQ